MQKEIDAYRSMVENHKRQAQIATDDRTRSEHLEIAEIYLARTRLLKKESYAPPD